MEISRPKDIKGGGQALSHFILQPMIKIKKKKKGGWREEEGKREERGGRKGGRGISEVEVFPLSNFDQQDHHFPRMHLGLSVITDLI